MKPIVIVILVFSQFMAFGNEIDSLKNLLSKKNQQANIYNQLAELYISDQTIESKKYADLALKKSLIEHDKFQEGRAYINIGDYYYYNSKYDSSLISYEKSLTLLKPINDNKSIASAYSNIGSIHFTKGNYKKAILNFKEAALFQSKTNDLQETAIIFNNIATVYYYTDDYDNSLTYYQKSLELKKRENDKSSIAKGLNNIANVYENIGDYEKAIDYYYQAIAFCDETNNYSLKATTLNNIAGVYKNWNQYDKALELYKEALTIKLNNKDRDGEANILNNIGVTYRLKGDLLLAEKNFEKAMAIFMTIGNLERLAKTYSNLGKVNEDNLKLVEALNYYHNALEINDSIQSPKGMALGNLDLARVYLLNNKINKAEFHINACHKIIQLHHIKSLQMDFYKLQSDFYTKKGDHKKAFDYFIKYSIIKDSIFTIEKHNTLNELNSKYETNKKNNEIEILKVKEEKQKTELLAKEQERTLWIGLSLLTTIFGLISIYFFWNKKQLSDQLKKKNKVIKSSLKEKEVLLREIHHRVKNNLQIITSLLNMQSRFLNDEKSKEIVNESKNRIKSMSLIHQKLYQEKELTGIETTTYFSELIDSIMQSYGINNENTTIKINVDSLLLDVDTAIPLGLIINELVSNAFKHGITDNSGEFIFKFLYNDNELHVVIKDNGKGIPPHIDIDKSKTYGMKLIKSLSKKLRASIEFKNNKGLEITMKISKFKLSKHS